MVLDAPAFQPAIAEAAAMREAALRLLRTLGAEQVQHVGGDLLSHLLGTEAILRDLDAPEWLVRAGLCHALYGTDGFAPSLLALSDRGRAAAAIGDASERAVYQYAACARAHVYAQLDRPEPTFSDRFTAQISPWPTSELSAFAVLTAANELELAERGVFEAASLNTLGGLFERLTPHAPAALTAALARLRAL